MQTQKKQFGNPVMAAAAAPAVINVTSKTASAFGNAAKYLLLGLGITVIFFVGSKALRKAKIESLKRRAFTDPNIKAAIDIYEAIPSGLKKGTGGFFNPFGFVKDAINKVKTIWQRTDTDRIMQVAETITDINSTATAFKIIYNEDLIQLLATAMEPDKYDEFVRRARRDKNPIPNKDIPSVSGKYVITKNETIGYVANPALFKTFNYDALQKGIVWKMKKRVPKNTFVGIAQGKIFTDKSTNIQYLMIAGLKNEYYLGLPVNDVKSMDESKFRKIESGVNKKFTLGNIDDLIRYVKTKKPTKLFLSDGRGFKTPAPKDVYIGEFLAQIHDPKTNLTMVNLKAFNGYEMWVDKNNIEIE